MTCDDMLKIPGMEKMKLVAGQGGIGRIITWVHVIEIPEVIEWVEGGELLFITGVTIKDDKEALLKLVNDINKKKLSGLVINVGPYIKNTPNEVIELARLVTIAGADAIAAINTVKSITRVDLDALTPFPIINGKSAVYCYSGKAIKPIALRFINDLAQNDKLKNVPISGMGGIETWNDAVEFILLGASNIQITTAIMQYGYRIIDDLISGLSIYMEENGFEKLDELVGLALKNIVTADKLDRNYIIYPKFNKDTCVGCGRCYISCYDGGHQAIKWNGENREVSLINKNCVGCHLCIKVCPVNAISSSKKIYK